VKPKRVPDLSWARTGMASAVREVMLSGLLGPLLDLYTRRRIVGREHLTGVAPPVLFVANHSSHMDTPTILRALPRPWRRRTAVSAAADGSRATRELGLSYTPAPDIFRRTIEWAEAEGLVTRPLPARPR
jgi:hypothetical protein